MSVWRHSRLLTEYLGLIGVLVVLALLFGATTDHFLTRLTFTTLANQIPALTVIAVGLTLVLIAGGIDVGAKRAVHAALRDLAARGKALVLVSSELPELMALCDRIAVLSDGRLVATFDRGDFDEGAITAAAFSGYQGSAAP